MRRYWRLVTLAVALLACLVIGGISTTSVSARPVIQTRLHFYSEFLRHSPFRFALSGWLHSTKHACIAGRRVELYLKRGNKVRLRDVGRTSSNGAFAVKARAEVHPDRFIIKVRQTRIAHRRYVCGSDRWGHRLHD
jgi:hypothetical protein